MTRILIAASAALAFAAIAGAQDAVDADTDAEASPPPPPSSAFNRSGPSSEPGDVLILRGLDKVTATTQDFPVRVGETAEFGSLSVTGRYCRSRPPEESPETFALLEVADRRIMDDGQQSDPENIFTGWMFASSPALNPLDHPTYDVWVLGCESASAIDPSMFAPAAVEEPAVEDAAAIVDEAAESIESSAPN